MYNNNMQLLFDIHILNINRLLICNLAIGERTHADIRNNSPENRYDFHV